MTLFTERLELICLSPEQLCLWTDDLPALEEALHCTYRAETIDGAFAQIVRGQALRWQAQGGRELWRSFFWMVRKTDRVVIGSADFKAPPNERGEVELGYGLAPEYEHCGYMTETVQALCECALAQPDVQAVLAETLTSNLPSQHVLQRCGFTLERSVDSLWWRLARG